MNVCLAVTARSTVASHPEYLLTMLVPSSNQTLVRNSSPLCLPFRHFMKHHCMYYKQTMMQNPFLEFKSHVANKLPTFCGTRMFNTVFAGSSLIHSKPVHPVSLIFVLILSPPPFTCIPIGHFPSGFLTT